MIDSATELSLLYTAIAYPERIDELMERCTIDSFADDTARKLFRGLQKAYKKNEHTGKYALVHNIATEVGEEWNELYKKFYEKSYLIESEFGSLIDRVTDMSKRRAIWEACSRIQEAVVEDEEIDNLIGKSQDLIMAATTDGRIDKYELSLADAITKYYDEFLLIQSREKPARGLLTGYPRLDGVLSGFKPGHVSIIAAATTMGKSAFALNIVNNIMKRGNSKIYIMTLEMAAAEMAERIVIQNAMVPASRYNKILEKAERDSVDRAINRIYEKPVHFNEERGLTVNQIKAKIRRKYRELGGLDLVVIDYLQMIRIADNSRNNTLSRAIGDVVAGVRNLAGELQIPILLLCQLSRSADRKHKARPDLSRLRDSGNIEEVADEVIFVYRPEDEGELQEAEIIVAKSRTGRKATLPFVWHEEFLYFNDQYLEERGQGLTYERSGA